MLESHQAIKLAIWHGKHVRLPEEGTMALPAEAEGYISSRRALVRDYDLSPTSAAFRWEVIDAEIIDPVDDPSPEDILGDIIEERLAEMEPREADAAIERGREILAACKSRGKQP
jgi:hypothetical protein